jgi:uncharacterized oligopeptide transporter (OPT) family protein
MLVGGVIGVLFVALLRRTMVEEKELGFPESVACAEVIKAGRKGSTGAGYLFSADVSPTISLAFKSSGVRQ